MTLLVFERLAGSPPPERELLTLEADGSAVAWLSNGPAVGRFGGPVVDLVAIRGAAEAVADLDVPGPIQVPPGAAIETIATAGRTARFVARRPVTGPWAPLVEACRSALKAISASPVAAIAGTVLPDGRFRLDHRGTEALPVELASLQVRFTLWRDGAEAGEGSAANAGQGRVHAGPGWSLELAPELLDLTGGGTLVAEATFVADDDGVFVPVRISANAAV